jgi:hypothetical protein
MGGNNFSSPHSLTCDKVADLVDTFGEAYSIYRPRILKNGIDGSVLVDYASLADSELDVVFVELEVTAVTHKLKFRRCIRSSFSGLFEGDGSKASVSVSVKPSETVFNMKSLEKVVLRVVTPLKLPEGKYHVFLTHDWGEEAKNHRRVSKINDILKSKYGLITWFDEDRMEGNIRNKMAKGIENSLSMIMFITSRYERKVTEGDDDIRDNCKVSNWSSCFDSALYILCLCIV